MRILQCPSRECVLVVLRGQSWIWCYVFHCPTVAAIHHRLRFGRQDVPKTCVALKHEVRPDRRSVAVTCFHRPFRSEVPDRMSLSSGCVVDVLAGASVMLQPRTEHGFKRS
ncbi:unnamed protein product [Effrenium voratum]|nr:unnamed protein product [Effrenium voratum]